MAIAPRIGMSVRGLRVLLMSRDESRASILEEGLRATGCAEVVRAREMRSLLRRIADEDPDVVFVDLGAPQREELEQTFEVSRHARRPIAVFVDHSEPEAIPAAVQAGIGAYVIDGLRKERVSAILALAVSRFHAFNKLLEELQRARQALEERKVVERAKGILMKDRALTEEQAYALLRKTAMNANRRLADVAQSLITAAGLLR
jgi:response regulator NasT